jgi:hypothetical protein
MMPQPWRAILPRCDKTHLPRAKLC